MAVVAGTICPQERPCPLLFPFNIPPHVLGAVLPRLFTLPLHEAASPIAAVDSAVLVPIDAIAAHQVGSPGTFVRVTVGVLKDAVLGGLVTLPGPLIHGPIFPLHPAKAMAHSSKPLPVVGSSRPVLEVFSFVTVAFNTVDRVRDTALNRFSVLVAGKVLWLLEAVLELLVLEMFLEIFLSDETSQACLQFYNGLSVLLFKLLIVNMAEVLTKEIFSVERCLELIIADLDRVAWQISLGQLADAGLFRFEDKVILVVQLGRAAGLVSSHVI